MRSAIDLLRRLMREVGGESRYRRYLAHQQAQHAGERPMDRAAFFRDEQRRKWQGVQRCC